ncbi:MAG: low molecular weight protein-tyrosine-phosphatase [Pseudomonadota bacterium]
MTSVLFVCLGNICRSPAAHGVFLNQLATAGLTQAIEVDSAGTGSWHIGCPPDERMTAAAAQRGVDLSPLRARKVIPEDFDRYTHIFAMDLQNLATMQQLASGKCYQPQLFLDLIASGENREVPDPYYGGDEGFETVLDMVDAACAALISRLRKQI